MAYFKRNNKLVDKAINIIATANLTDDEKITLMSIINDYEENTFKEWDDRGEFYANAVEDMVNDTCFDENKFADRVTKWHRTLQQTFFNIVLATIRKFGNNEYNYDGRNESAHILASQLNSFLEKEGINHNCPCI